MNRAEIPTLDGKFFQAQALVTPGEVGQEEDYLRIACEHQALLANRFTALNLARSPWLAAEGEYRAASAVLQAKRGEIYEQPPVAGDWRQLLTKARAELRVALSRNTVPFPLIPLARLVALPEHPEVQVLSQKVNQLGIRSQDMAKQTEQREKDIEQQYSEPLDEFSKSMTSERNKLLTGYEIAVALTGKVDTVAGYLGNLSMGLRVSRIAPTVDAFIKANEVTLLEGTNLREFEQLVNQVTSGRPKERLRNFIGAVTKELDSAKESNRIPNLEVFSEFDTGYPWRRWRAFLVYSVNEQLHQSGILETPPQIPQVLWR